MPKATKKKKEKTADFVKPKLKLGKGKKPAANAVDTSFKARSIALPNQSITASKDEATPTTRRKLSFDDLLAHLRHYSPGVRKDALHGLRELLEQHTHLIQQHLLQLINATVRLTSDEDPSIRKGLLAFYSWLLPKLPTSHLAPHAEILLLYTTSAQTHIFPEIRLDAVKFLDLLLEVVPEYVASGCLDQTQGQDAESSGSRSGSTRGHGRKVLDGYLSLLSTGMGSGSGGAGPSQGIPAPSVAMLSPTSKASVLSSLSKFLRIALLDPSTSNTDSNTPTLPLAFLASSFATPFAFASFISLLQPTHAIPNFTSRSIPRSTHNTVHVLESDPLSEDNFVGPYPFAYAYADEGDGSGGERLQDLNLDLSSIWAEVKALETRTGQSSRLGDAAGDGVEDSAYQEQLCALCTALQPVLVSTFLDCAPSVFAPAGSGAGSESDDMKLALSVLDIARSVYGRLLRENGGGKLAKRIKPTLEGLRTLLTHMAPYFPFGSNALTQQDIKVSQTFQTMNIIYCELFSLLSLVTETETDAASVSRRQSQTQTQARGNATLPSWVSSISQIQSTRNTSGGRSRGRQSNNASKEHDSSSANSSSAHSKQSERVHAFIKRALQGHRLNNASSGIAELDLDRQAYVALLPTVWSILCQGGNGDEENESEEGGLLDALLDHATRLASTNGVKGVATEFVARLVLLESERTYRGAFRLCLYDEHGRKTQTAGSLRKWVEHLPKVLWELGDRQLVMSETILRFLLRLLQRNHPLIGAEASSSLKARLAPFFAINHSTRGEVLGPFTKLAMPTSSSAAADAKLGLGLPAHQAHQADPFVSPLKSLVLDVVSLLLAYGQHYGHGGGVSNSKQSAGSAPSVPSDRTCGDAHAVALVEAVEKALKGTNESGYWEGIKSVRMGANVGLACA